MGQNIPIFLNIHNKCNKSKLHGKPSMLMSIIYFPTIRWKMAQIPEILTLQLQLAAQPFSFQQKKYLSYRLSFGISKHCNLQNTIYISTDATIRSQDAVHFCGFRVHSIRFSYLTHSWVGIFGFGLWTYFQIWISLFSQSWLQDHGLDHKILPRLELELC